MIRSQGNVLSSIARWRLSLRMQRVKERHHDGCLRRAQIFSVGWHIASALDNLSHELIPGEAKRHLVEGRSALASLAVERMAVAALLLLEHDGASPLQRGTPVEIRSRDWHAAPRVHHRAPGCMQS